MGLNTGTKKYSNSVDSPLIQDTRRQSRERYQQSGVSIARLGYVNRLVRGSTGTPRPILRCRFRGASGRDGLETAKSPSDPTSRWPVSWVADIVL